MTLGTEAFPTNSAGAFDQLKKRALAGFAEQYGRPARWLAAAPGRVNLIGEHTDYNDGFVLPMAIDRYTLIAADRAPRDRGNAVRLRSSAGDQAEFSACLSLAPEPGSWSNYVRGVLVGCLRVGLQPGGFDAWIESDVPIGAGLSSSAALEVAAATLLAGMSGRKLDPLEAALLCQRAEHEFAGMPCGIMDQFASALGRQGHLLLLDCRSTEVEMIPFADPDVSVLVVNSNVKHALVGGEYAQRRSECAAAARALGVGHLRDATLPQLDAARAELGPVLYRRARHVITEIARTLDAAAAIGRGDWLSAGRAMYTSHESLRVDFEVSCPELDVLVQLAQNLGESAGVIGSRMTGGGFGGCTISLVRSSAAAQVTAALELGYKTRTTRAAGSFVTRPSRGAFLAQITDIAP